jgi:hypothetical protein
MKSENESTTAPLVFKDAMEVVMKVFSEKIPSHKQLERFLELQGDANLPLVSEHMPQTRVQLMQTLRERFNLSPENRVLYHLFDHYSAIMKLPLK